MIIKFGIPVDQMMCIKCTTWRTGSFNAKKANLLCIFIILLIFFFNFHLNFTFKYEQSGENHTFVEACEESKIMNSWLYVNY